MKHLCLLLGIMLIFFACNRNDQEPPEPTDFGYLSMNISVTITSETANGRVTDVPTDDWKVTIFDASDDSEEISFDPYSSAPAEIQLPTGEYYIEAHSNNLVEAAFENPYYFGRSDNFTIDKEELETVDVDAELANSKVSINYSSNVTSTFNSYSGEVTVVSSGTSLAYVQGETREGYFVAEPLSVVVDLSYTKQDGSFITRQFTADIDAEPKTLYNINVDASLEDGEIVLNINVDETFETVDIDLSDADDLPFEENGFMLGDTFYPTSTGVFGCSELTGFNDCQFLLSNGSPDLCSGTQFVSIAGIASSGSLSELAPGEYTFSTQNSGPENEPEVVNTFIWSLAITDISGFDGDCELLPGYDIWDTDQHGTDSGRLTISKDGEVYTLIFEFQFTDGPLVRGSYQGEIIDLNS